jgi:RNA polymerase sigma factor (sigma-70 family)
VPLDDIDFAFSDDEAEELVALDEALTRLAEINPRGGEVVQYRFFGGLTLQETADLLGVSAKTVQRDWLAARAWLRKEVAKDLGILGATDR